MAACQSYMNVEGTPEKHNNNRNGVKDNVSSYTVVLQAGIVFQILSMPRVITKL